MKQKKGNIQVKLKRPNTGKVQHLTKCIEFILPPPQTVQISNSSDCPQQHDSVLQSVFQY